MREEEFFPRFNAMAGFTPGCHFLFELPFMNIFVTSRAMYRAFPMKLPRTLGIYLVIDVTRYARNGDVCTEQCKPGIFMIVRRIAHTNKINLRVARFALSTIGAFGKLSCVCVGMAIGTPLKFRDVKPEFPARILLPEIVLMAVSTFQ